MKLVLLFLVALGIVFYFKSPSLFLAQAKTATSSANSTKQAIIASGDVLGVAISLAKNTLNQLFPPQTSARLINTVQSNVQSVVSDVTNNVFANQLINNFKNLPKPVQEQVKQNICK